MWGLAKGGDTFAACDTPSSECSKATVVGVCLRLGCYLVSVISISCRVAMGTRPAFMPGMAGSEYEL